MKGFSETAILLLPSGKITQYWNAMQWLYFNTAIKNLLLTFEEQLEMTVHIFQSAVVGGENGKMELYPSLGIVKTISRVDEDYVNFTEFKVVEPTIIYRDHDAKALKKYPAVRGLDEDARIQVVINRCLFTEKYLTKTYYKVICDLEFSTHKRVAYRPKEQSGVIYLPFNKEYKCNQGYIGDKQMNIGLLSDNLLSDRSLLKWR